MQAAAVGRLIENARQAQQQVQSASQEQVDAWVAAAGWAMYQDTNARRITALAAEETEMGRAADTYLRHRKRVLGVLRDLHQVVTVGLTERHPDLGLTKIAKPVGVIAAITPTTAPTAAIAQNALLALKTRNAMIFCPNPRAQQVAHTTVELMRSALLQAGAPADVLQCICSPTRQAVDELMHAADLILAAGGASTVRRAYSSGKPAYGAGTGNAVVVIDESADLADACAKSFHGKAFDNGTACSSESSLVIAQACWDAALAELQRLGAHLCNSEEISRLRAAAWPDGRTIARDVVGRDAEAIAKLARIPVRAGVRVLLAPLETAAAEDPLCGEKLSPILALWKFHSFDAALELVRRLVRISGHGHSCGIHTQRQERVALLAQAVNVSRVMVNQSTGFGNSGDFTNGMPFTSVLCCGTWGGSISNENITWRHLLNHTWVAEPIPAKIPQESDLFGAHWLRYGR